MRRWWTIEDLFSVMPRLTLERLLDASVDDGEAGYDAVCDACDRAQKITAEILGSRAPKDDEPVAAVIIECVVVTAAWHLSFRSDIENLPEKFDLRYREAKKLIDNLRDGTDAPRVGTCTVNVRAPYRRFTFS